jgi:hypothetical protein
MLWPLLQYPAPFVFVAMVVLLGLGFAYDAGGSPATRKWKLAVAGFCLLLSQVGMLGLGNLIRQDLVRATAILRAQEWKAE